jgi:hypothetical protein
MEAHIHAYGGDEVNGLPTVRHWQLVVDNIFIADTSNKDLAVLYLEIVKRINNGS